MVYSTNDQKTNLINTRSLKLLFRDFEGTKAAAEKFLKTYYPDRYKDFTGVHSGQIFLDLLSFIGDSLNYNLDYNFKELFLLQDTNEIKNVINLAKSIHGYKVKGKSSSVGKLDLYIEVPAATQTDGTRIPNSTYCIKILRNSSITKDNGKSYLIDEDCDFSVNTSADPLEISVAQTDAQNNVTYFTLKKSVYTRSGELKIYTFDLTNSNYTNFLSLVLPDEDVLDIESLVDNEGNTYYEVEYLAQDMIFISKQNDNDDSSLVPYVLKFKSTPYRFVREYDPITNLTKLRFGSGDAKHSINEDIVPNIDDLAIPIYGKTNFASILIDPENYLKTSTLGISPYNTKLTVTYSIGGGEEDNAASGEIRNIGNIYWDYSTTNIDLNILDRVRNSLVVNNSEFFDGGSAIKEIQNIKEEAIANYKAQDRIVSDEDLISRAYSMPTKFGNIFRVSLQNSENNIFEREIFLWSKSGGYLTSASSTLKENLKNYLKYYRLISDAYSFYDGKIINFQIKYKILVDSSLGVNKFEVLSKCSKGLKEYFNLNKWQPNQPINISQIESLLQSIVGVYSVADLKFENIVSYGNIRFNMDENTENNVIYCNKYSMFELRDQNTNIIGISA